MNEFFITPGSVNGESAAENLGLDIIFPMFMKIVTNTT